MTRYVAAYANEIDAFIAKLGGKAAEIPVGRDGLNALLIAEAAVAPHSPARRWTCCKRRNIVSRIAENPRVGDMRFPPFGGVWIVKRLIGKGIAADSMSRQLKTLILRG